MKYEIYINCFHFQIEVNYFYFFLRINGHTEFIIFLNCGFRFLNKHEMDGSTL